MKEKFNLWVDAARFWLLKTHAKKSGAKVDPSDSNDFGAILDFGEEPFFVEIRDGNIWLEKPVLYSSNLSNLYTFSSVCHVASNFGTICTGLTMKDGLGKFYLIKKVSLSVLTRPNTFEGELFEFNECIANVAGYLTHRRDKVSSRTLDLSMFQDLNLYEVDLQRLGECKDFRFGSWEGMLDSYMCDEFSFKSGDIPLDLLIYACDDFENENNLIISEVGDEVLDEANLHKSISIVEAAKEYSVH